MLRSDNTLLCEFLSVAMSQVAALFAEASDWVIFYWCLASWAVKEHIPYITTVVTRQRIM